jgi:hypothetical protein
MRDTITLEGNSVDDPICIEEPAAKSIIPGFPGDRDGEYCLVKYDDCQELREEGVQEG